MRQEPETGQGETHLRVGPQRVGAHQRSQALAAIDLGTNIGRLPDRSANTSDGFRIIDTIPKLSDLRQRG